MKNKSLLYLNGFVVIVFLAAIVHLLYCNYRDLGSTDPEAWDSYYWYGISDYLINYQGGFVRRGFIGEVLYQIFNVHGYPVNMAIVALDFTSFVLFIALWTYAFKKRQWSLLPLLFPYVCAHINLLGFRRDFLMMVILFIVYDLFFRYLSSRKRCYIFSSMAVLCLCLLIYEPCMFLTIPVMGLSLLLKNSEGTSLKSGFYKTIPVLIAPVVLVVVLLFSKGSPDAADRIWESWQPLFATYSNVPVTEMGTGVSFLKFTLPEFIEHNFSFLVLIDKTPVGMIVVNLILMLISFPLVWYLVARVPVVNYRKMSIEKNPDSVLLGSVFIVQFISMLPMFGFLSCDIGRTLPYCIYTTFIIVYLSRKHNVQISMTKYIDGFSGRLNSCIDGSRWLGSYLLYLLVIFLTPLNAWCAPHLEDNIITYFVTLIQSLW